MLHCKSQSIGQDNQHNGATSRHVTTLRVKAPFHPPNRTTTPPQGDTSVRASIVEEWPASVPTDEAFKPPRPVTNVAEFIDYRQKPSYTEKIVVLQIVSGDGDLLPSV